MQGGATGAMTVRIVEARQPTPRPAGAGRRYSVAMTAPVFIVGVPRSGTTLLAAMFNAHPRIAVTPETFFLEWALRHQGADLRRDLDLDGFLDAYAHTGEFARLGLDRARLRARFREAAGGDFAALFRTLLQAYAEHQGKPRAGEKTPRHHLYLDTLRAWFPEAPLLFVARDPRAVAASLLRVPWASNDVEEHAWRWRDAVRGAARHQGDGRFAVTRYRDLVRQPRAELERLCGVIGEDFNGSMLAFASSAGALVGGEDHKAGVLRPLDETSIDKWRRQLSEHQVATIEQITATQMAQLGFRCETGGLGVRARLALHARRVAARAVRARRRWAAAERP